MPDIIVPDPDPTRGGLAGYVNKRALLATAEIAYDRATAALRGGQFPILYGGDRAVLLGAIPDVLVRGGMRVRMLTPLQPVCVVS